MMYRNRLISIIASILTGASLAQAQLPVISTIQGPMVNRTMRREPGRAADLPALFDASPVNETPALNVARLLFEDSQTSTGPLRSGIGQPLKMSSLNGTGLWWHLDDGGWLWTARVHLAGAKASRLRLSGWNPPSGAELSVYSANDPRDVYGPFTLEDSTGSEPFWTPILQSDEIHVEYYLPPGSGEPAKFPPIFIDHAISQYRDFGGRNGNPADEVGCHLDVTCYPAWASAASAVGILANITVVPPTTYIQTFCSGALLNRNPADFTPLFMTATHCGVTDATLASTYVIWLYQTPSCGGTPPSIFGLQQTKVTTLLARDVTTDWTILGMSNTVPGGTAYLGSNPNYFGDGSSAISISHPDGSYKRIAFGGKNGDGGSRPNPAGGTSCIGGSSSQVTFLLGLGLTEPGSSGSPIFDSSQLVRGTLSCGPPPTCSGSNAGNYGRLDQAFPYVTPYLNPVDPVFANSGFSGFEIGTSANPFAAVKRAVFAVRSGSTVWMSAGNYPDNVRITRPMTLRATAGTVTIGN